MLNEIVVPQATALAGFQSGTWMNARGNGMGVVVFDTEQNANEAQMYLQPPDGAPTTFVSSSVTEVGAQATPDLGARERRPLVLPSLAQCRRGSSLTSTEN